MMKHVLAIVAVLSFAVVAQAGVTIDVAIAPNGDGNLVYTLTAISDGEPITSLGINAVADPGSSLGQVHPAANSTHLGDFNSFFTIVPATVDQDTQAMFATAADSLLVVANPLDTAEELDVNFTGFAPFMSRAVVQVVIIGEGGVATIGAVAGGEEYTNVVPLPEPATLSMLAIGGLLAIRRR